MKDYTVMISFACFVCGVAIGVTMMGLARDAYWKKAAVAHGAATYVYSNDDIEFRWNDAPEVGP